MRPFLIGILAAIFFSTTFILNRLMELDGGFWVWSASLRYMFMIPMLLIILGFKKNVKPVFDHLKKQPLTWLIWSTIGFGLFYAPLTYATVHGPGWLVAATFQLTIITGSLLVPFLNPKGSLKEKIPIQSVFISLIILAGIFVMQLEHASSAPILSVVLVITPILIAAFAYPLGNRKMMQVVGSELNTFQRILGMTIASMPFWIILSIYALVTHGLPSSTQVGQTFIVSISSGMIATTLYFFATELVRNNNQQLAGVEATQATVVIFAVFGESFLLKTPLPSTISFIGIGLVIFGMILHSTASTILNKRKSLIYNKVSEQKR